jgi:phage-related protein
MSKRYLWIDCTWRWRGRGCRYVTRAVARISRNEYITEVLAVKLSH